MSPSLIRFTIASVLVIAYLALLCLIVWFLATRSPNHMVRTLLAVAALVAALPAVLAALHSVGG